MDNKPQWSDWYWGDTGIFRRRYSDWKIEEECSDCVYLKQHLEPLHRLKQELIDRAAQAKGSRKREFERGVKSKEEQIEYVSQRLQLLQEIKEMPQVEVVPAEALTQAEQRELKQLEEEIEQSFVRAGRALAVIRDKRLYREKWATFADYVRERFGFTRQNADYQIAAAEIVEVLTSNACQIVPTSVRQAYPLSTLEDEEQIVSAWQQAIEDSNGKRPSGTKVKSAVERIKESIRRRANIPCPFQAGEVCQILGKGNPDLRGLAGVWCIVEEIQEFTILVQTWRGEFIVKEENLKSLDLNLQEQEKYQKDNRRISAVAKNCNDPYLFIALEGLGNRNTPILTSGGQELLAFLEKVTRTV